MSFVKLIERFNASLHSLGNGDLSVFEFCKQWRNNAQVRELLPARYGLVLNDLLSRLESGAMFSEESCSFSVADVRSSLAVWSEKAILAGAPDETS